MPTQHEQAREIRERLGYQDFPAEELEFAVVCGFRGCGARRVLFDRAVVWLLRHRVLLPGISELSRLVTEVRAGEYDRIHAMMASP